MGLLHHEDLCSGGTVHFMAIFTATEAVDQRAAVPLQQMVSDSSQAIVASVGSLGRAGGGWNAAAWSRGGRC